MVKYVCALLMLLMTSGCCELFGLCTSVNVHTSADSPNEIASTDVHAGLLAAAPSGIQSSPQSSLMAAGDERWQSGLPGAN
jgi:hypothetical protein